MSTIPHTQFDLRPLSLGDIIGRAAQLYRSNFATLVGIVAIAQVPVVILQIIISIATFDPAINQFSTGGDLSTIFTPTFFIGQIATFLIAIANFFLISLARAAVAQVTAINHFDHKQPTLAEAISQTLKSLARLLPTLVLALLASVVLFVGALIPCLGWFTLAYGLGVILPLIIFCCVLEGKNGIAAFGRAWELARRRFWWVFGFIVLLVTFSLIVTYGPAIVIGAILAPILNASLGVGNPKMIFIIQTSIQSLATLLIFVLNAPFQMVCETLVYFDLRVRGEGVNWAPSTPSEDQGRLAESAV